MFISTLDTKFIVGLNPVNIAFIYVCQACLVQLVELISSFAGP